MSETTTQATEATVRQPRAKGAKNPGSSTKKATPKKGAPKAKKGAKKQPATKAKAKKPEAGSGESKKAIVLELLRRPNGATLDEIMSTTNWLRHTVRGFISAAVGKKLGLTVESTRNVAGNRVYRIIK